MESCSRMRCSELASCMVTTWRTRIMTRVLVPSWRRSTNHPKSLLLSASEAEATQLRMVGEIAEPLTDDQEMSRVNRLVRYGYIIFS